MVTQAYLKEEILVTDRRKCDCLILNFNAFFSFYGLVQPIAPPSSLEDIGESLISQKCKRPTLCRAIENIKVTQKTKTTTSCIIFSQDKYIV